MKEFFTLPGAVTARGRVGAARWQDWTLWGLAIWRWVSRTLQIAITCVLSSAIQCYREALSGREGRFARYALYRIGKAYFALGEYPRALAAFAGVLESR